MTSNRRWRPHYRARDAFTFHWDESQSVSAKLSVGLSSHVEPGVGNTAEDHQILVAAPGVVVPGVVKPLDAAKRICRSWANKTAKRICRPWTYKTDKASLARITGQVIVKYRLLESCPGEQVEACSATTEVGHQKMAKRYTDALSRAVNVERLFDLPILAIVVLWPFAVGIAFLASGESVAASLLLSVAVGALVVLPESPSSSTLRLAIGKIFLLSIAAFFGYPAWSRFTESGTIPPSSGVLGVLGGGHFGFLIVTWLSAAALCAITALLILRLARDEWVGRLLAVCTQESLVLELVWVAEILERQQERLDWVSDNEAKLALGRLGEAQLLAERYVWYPKKRMKRHERRQVANIIKALLREILQLRSKLLRPTRNTAVELREQAIKLAGLVQCGYFGELSSGMAGGETSLMARLRASLVRLLCDLPLALVPFGAIWMFDQIGLNSPEYATVRGTLLGMGVFWAMFVAARALDPSSPGKITLFGQFLSMFGTWGGPPVGGKPDVTPGPSTDWESNVKDKE